MAAPCPDKRPFPSACTTTPKCRPRLSPRALRAFDVDGVPAAGAVGLGQAEGLGLQLAGAVCGAGDERRVGAGSYGEAALPAHPGITAGGGVNQGGRLPGVPAIGAELDLLDATVAGIGYPGDALSTALQPPIARRHVD